MTHFQSGPSAATTQAESICIELRCFFSKALCSPSVAHVHSLTVELLITQSFCFCRIATLGCSLLSPDSGPPTLPSFSFLIAPVARFLFLVYSPTPLDSSLFTTLDPTNSPELLLILQCPCPPHSPWVWLA